MSESSVRDELYDAIRQLGQSNGPMRMGQLLAAAGELCADLHGHGLWEASDDEFLEALWKLNQDLNQRESSSVRESA
jgi:hypothetical protein